MPTSPAIAAALRRKLRQTADSRFWLRLFTSLLVSVVFTFADAARVTGVSTRSARRWWQAYKQNADSGLREKLPVGRPAQLTSDQNDAIASVIRRSPRAVGLDKDAWTGKT